MGVPVSAVEDDLEVGADPGKPSIKQGLKADAIKPGQFLLNKVQLLELCGNPSYSTVWGWMTKTGFRIRSNLDRLEAGLPEWRGSPLKFSRGWSLGRAAPSAISRASNGTGDAGGKPKAARAGPKFAKRRVVEARAR